jgi:hypothetical protein
MIAFEKYPEEIEIVRKQLQAHYEADEIVKGQYWEDGKGCAVGCILHSSNHKEFEDRFGIPEWVARLVDTLFEGLPNDRAKEFPLQFWKAVAKCKGKDLMPIKWKFLAFVMQENIKIVEGLERLDESIKSQGLDVLRDCERLYADGEPSKIDLSATWSAARSVRSAASLAAESAERFAAESVMWSVIWSAESVAESAAWSVKWSIETAAWSVAWSVIWSVETEASVVYAEKLLELLEELGEQA